MIELTRRTFMAGSCALLGTGFAGCSSAQDTSQSRSAVIDATPEQLFGISLAQWSLHRAFFANRVSPEWRDPMQFARIARNAFDIGAIEYVNSFYQHKAREHTVLRELKTIADGEGVKSLLIMCDGEGRIGDPDAQARSQAVENHHKWADMAAYLGCHSIRVNLESAGSFEEQQKLAADGLVMLADYCTPLGLNVIVENHGGWSSHGAWLAGVMQVANKPNVGTLPDFGNFSIARGNDYDIYLGVEQLMPYAKGVSAKSFRFDNAGNEAGMDYERLLRIVLESGYRGYLGIEYEGHDLPEWDGIRKTKALLERLREKLSADYTV